MSGPVDVLAVLRELRDAHVRTNGALMSEHDGSLARIDGAIAAVAELLDKADAVASIYGPLSASMRLGSDRREAWEALFFALARCKGGAA